MRMPLFFGHAPAHVQATLEAQLVHAERQASWQRMDGKKASIENFDAIGGPAQGIRHVVLDRDGYAVDTWFALGLA